MPAVEHFERCAEMLRQTARMIHGRDFIARRGQNQHAIAVDFGIAREGTDRAMHRFESFEIQRLLLGRSDKTYGRFFKIRNIFNTRTGTDKKHAHQ